MGTSGDGARQEPAALLISGQNAWWDRWAHARHMVPWPTPESRLQPAWIKKVVTSGLKLAGFLALRVGMRKRWNFLDQLQQRVRADSRSPFRLPLHYDSSSCVPPVCCRNRVFSHTRLRLEDEEKHKMKVKIYASKSSTADQDK